MCKGPNKTLTSKMLFQRLSVKINKGVVWTEYFKAAKVFGKIFCWNVKIYSLNQYNNLLKYCTLLVSYHLTFKKYLNLSFA